MYGWRHALDGTYAPVILVSGWEIGLNESDGLAIKRTINHKELKGVQVTRVSDLTTVMTSKEVADACRVSRRTANNWFDAKKIEGYRIPGSLHRRFLRESVIEFLKKHGMPYDHLQNNPPTESPRSNDSGDQPKD